VCFPLPVAFLGGVCFPLPVAFLGSVCFPHIALASERLSLLTNIDLSAFAPKVTIERLKRSSKRGELKFMSFLSRCGSQCRLFLGEYLIMLRLEYYTSPFCFASS
jgi:hypothetical protein